MPDVLQTLQMLMTAGGWVMYPLLAVSVLSLTFSAERAIYWLGANRAGRGRRRWLHRVGAALRAGELSVVRTLVEEDRSVYGRFVRAMLKPLQDGQRAGEAVALEAMERVRGEVERFGATLSTIITAAPMLGILGTVVGIIASFRAIGVAQSAGQPVDPSAVASGIAQALFTTAFGLIIAIATLFPYVIYRGASERCISRLEMLASSTPGISSAPAGG